MKPDGVQTGANRKCKDRTMDGINFNNSFWVPVVTRRSVNIFSSDEVDFGPVSNNHVYLFSMLGLWARDEKGFFGPHGPGMGRRNVGHTWAKDWGGGICWAHMGRNLLHMEFLKRGRCMGILRSWAGICSIWDFWETWL